MFTTLSRAGIGMYTTLLVSILRALGFDLDRETTTEAVLAIAQGIGAILWIVGQFVRKDLSWGVFRRKK